MLIFYDGHIIDNAEFILSHSNRAFMYGDGLFETMIWKDNQLRFEQYHKERLMSGMSALNLMLDKKLNVSTIFSGIHQLVIKSGHSSVRIRLQVWRAVGGLYTPENSNCHVLAICYTVKLHQTLPKEKVSFSNTVRLNKTNWSAFKTISAIPYVQAGIEKTQRNLDELILLDNRNYVSECSSSNIFWKKEETYYTPSLNTGCVDGIMRRHIINQLNKHKVDLHIGEYAVDALLEADEIFACNVTGISPILSIDEHPFSKILSIIPLLRL